MTVGLCFDSNIDGFHGHLVSKVWVCLAFHCISLSEVTTNLCTSITSGRVFLRRFRDVFLVIIIIFFGMGNWFRWCHVGGFIGVVALVLFDVSICCVVQVESMVYTYDFAGVRGFSYCLVTALQSDRAGGFFNFLVIVVGRVACSTSVSCSLHIL